MRPRLGGVLIASVALGLLAAAPGSAGAAEHAEGEVKCQGINGCAGKGECNAPDGSHDCGGKNSCKGKGWVSVGSAEECTEKGGSVVEEWWFWTLLVALVAGGVTVGVVLGTQQSPEEGTLGSVQLMQLEW